MKYDFLEILRCPTCKTRLDLSVAEEEHGEVKTGTLTCAGGVHTYRVSKFVPRFVDADKYADSFSLQRLYVRKHFKYYREDKTGDELFFPTTGFDPEEIKQGHSLEIGAGYGRFVDVVQRAGGKIVGVDLSTHSIELAQDFAGLRANVYLVQADLFSLPFEEKTFQHVFSIGVLHHTPSTEAAFSASRRTCARRPGVDLGLPSVAEAVHRRVAPSHGADESSAAVRVLHRQPGTVLLDSRASGWGEVQPNHSRHPSAAGPAVLAARARRLRRLLAHLRVRARTRRGGVMVPQGGPEGRPAAAAERPRSPVEERSRYGGATGAHMRIAIFGLGYVGSVSAACLGSAGHDIIGVDVEPQKLALLRSGRSPVTEPDLDELLSDVLSRGHLRVTDDTQDAVKQSDVRSYASGRRAAATASHESQYLSAWSSRSARPSGRDA
jgi:uncharacterized protein YbaR (Trm112 family)